MLQITLLHFLFPLELVYSFHIIYIYFFPRISLPLILSNFVVASAFDILPSVREYLADCSARSTADFVRNLIKIILFSNRVEFLWQWRAVSFSAFLYFRDLIVVSIASHVHIASSRCVCMRRHRASGLISFYSQH